MYFLTKPMKVDAPAYWIANILGSRESSWMYQGFSRIRGTNREAILNTCGSIQGFVNLLLDYKGEGIPSELLIASDDSQKVARSSLETDHIVYGEQLENLIPDA